MEKENNVIQKKDNKKTILIIVLCVVVILLGVLTWFLLTRDNKENNLHNEQDIKNNNELNDTIIESFINEDEEISYYKITGNMQIDEDTDTDVTYELEINNKTSKVSVGYDDVLHGTYDDGIVIDNKYIVYNINENKSFENDASLFILDNNIIKAHWTKHPVYKLYYGSYVYNEVGYNIDGSETSDCECWNNQGNDDFNCDKCRGEAIYDKITFNNDNTVTKFGWARNAGGADMKCNKKENNNVIILDKCKTINFDGTDYEYDYYGEFTYLRANGFLVSTLGHSKSYDYTPTWATLKIEKITKNDLEILK